MVNIDMGGLDKEKDINFIVFNEAQNFFTDDKPYTVNQFVNHLYRKYTFDYIPRVIKNILSEMAEDGHLKWYTSDKFLLNKKEN